MGISSNKPILHVLLLIIPIRYASAFLKTFPYRYSHSLRLLYVSINFQHFILRPLFHKIIMKLIVNRDQRNLMAINQQEKNKQDRPTRPHDGEVFASSLIAKRKFSNMFRDAFSLQKTPYEIAFGHQLKTFKIQEIHLTFTQTPINKYNISNIAIKISKLKKVCKCIPVNNIS